jgi:type VI secretion system protein ImpK
MSTDDPFASLDGEGTILIPKPGGRSTPKPTEPPPTVLAEGSVPVVASDSGLNPLLAAANPLLNLVPRLRGLMSHPDPAGLKETLVRHVRQFEVQSKAAGSPPEKVNASRYVLCTMLDETVTSTPWGGSGAWGGHSLLVTFHNETWGGEKFFQLLAKLAENPSGNRDLLELMYVCLGLGFEGRFRVIDNGRSQLEALRERLAQLLRNQRGEYERDLSPHWRGVVSEKNPVFQSLPLWVAGAVAGVLLVGIYFALSISLNQTSDPIFSAIQGIRVKSQTPRQVAPAAPVSPRLAAFLKPEIDAGLVAVLDEGSRSVVTIRGDGIFDAGSANVSSEVGPLLSRIAKALNAVPGQVLITGHTDSIPIRTARFPSNWHLSVDRAKSVARLLSADVSPTRLSAEGRADGEPVAPNDTPGHRAQNRRVEITLFVAQRNA